MMMMMMISVEQRPGWTEQVKYICIILYLILGKTYCLPIVYWVHPRYNWAIQHPKPLQELGKARPSQQEVLPMGSAASANSRKSIYLVVESDHHRSWQMTISGVTWPWTRNIVLWATSYTSSNLQHTQMQTCPCVCMCSRSCGWCTYILNSCVRLYESIPKKQICKFVWHLVSSEQLILTCTFTHSIHIQNSHNNHRLSEHHLQIIFQIPKYNLT